MCLRVQHCSQCILSRCLFALYAWLCLTLVWIVCLLFMSELFAGVTWHMQLSGPGFSQLFTWLVQSDNVVGTSLVVLLAFIVLTCRILDARGVIE